MVWGGKVSAAQSITSLAWARQEQMAQNHPLLEYAVLIHLIGPRLADHLLDGRLGRLRVIRRPGVVLCPLGVGIFEVGQINLNLPLQRPEGLHPVIAPAVPHHRHGQGLFQGLRHHLGIVGGID